MRYISLMILLTAIGVISYAHQNSPNENSLKNFKPPPYEGLGKYTPLTKEKKKEEMKKITKYYDSEKGLWYHKEITKKTLHKEHGVHVIKTIEKVNFAQKGKPPDLQIVGSFIEVHFYDKEVHVLDIDQGEYLSQREGEMTTKRIMYIRRGGEWFRFVKEERKKERE